MKKAAIVIALLLLIVSPMAVHAAQLNAGQISNDPLATGDRTKENACDCCQKCKAAKGSVKTEEEEDALEKDGCGDCCTRCGQPLKPMPEATPPEKIEKKLPPDIIEKGKDQ